MSKRFASRRFVVIITCLLRCVFAGTGLFFLSMAEQGLDQWEKTFTGYIWLRFFRYMYYLSPYMCHNICRCWGGSLPRQAQHRKWLCLRTHNLQLTHNIMRATWHRNAIRITEVTVALREGGVGLPALWFPSQRVSKSELWNFLGG